MNIDTMSRNELTTYVKSYMNRIDSFLDRDVDGPDPSSKGFYQDAKAQFKQILDELTDDSQEDSTAIDRELIKLTIENFNTQCKEINQMEAMVSELIEVFKKKYTPAHSFVSADEFFTTDEIKEMFSTTLNVDRIDLFYGLKNAGYEIMMVNKELRWLVHEE
jgi:hypothetical protein